MPEFQKKIFSAKDVLRNAFSVNFIPESYRLDKNRKNFEVFFLFTLSTGGNSYHLTLIIGFPIVSFCPGSLRKQLKMTGNDQNATRTVSMSAQDHVGQLKKKFAV